MGWYQAGCETTAGAVNYRPSDVTTEYRYKYVFSSGIGGVFSGEMEEFVSRVKVEHLLQAHVHTPVTFVAEFTGDEVWII